MKTPVVKIRLIALRQDPKYAEIRPTLRAIMRYIEKLEKELTRYKPRQ